MNLPASFYILYHDFGRHGIGVVGDLILTEADALNTILETSKDSPSMLLHPDRWKCYRVGHGQVLYDRTLHFISLAYLHHFKESPPWE